MHGQSTVHNAMHLSVECTLCIGCHCTDVLADVPCIFTEGEILGKVPGENI